MNVQPLTQGRAPFGPRVDAVAVDLSQGGVRYVSDQPLLTSLALIELQSARSEQTVLLVAERIRCRRVGAMFEIALRFVEKLAAKVGNAGQ